MTSKYDDYASRFRALAHPVRLQILDMLRGGEVCVCHMEAALGKRQAYISQQLIVLREAGLVEARKDGLQVFYRLVDPTLEDLLTATLGSVIGIHCAPVDGCPCPHCEYSWSSEIRKEENNYEHVNR
jgi:ArsR family transcriptional regulator